ncbi:transglutaminase family protein [Bremerella sp. JC817]|uniref:transglutaminase-like domain-containing protein n=1 Tax=Bremerella sp. JC817 TaxID=3231756 RepID=UPI00345A5C21
MVKQFFAATLLLLACGSWASAQFGAVETPAASSGGVGNFETGFTLQVQGPALGVTATFPVPANWQDQKVELVRQELPPGASLKFLDLDGTSQARVDIPRMSAGETAKVMLYFQVDRQPIVAPNRPESLTAPSQKQLDRTQRKYLLPGPFVESRDNKITTVAQSLAKPDASTWDQVEAYYDFVHQNVTYENGPMKGAVAALEEGRGDCEEMTTLFVALCRAGNIPARTVWVPGHCYPEFLTKTDDGTDRWVAVEMTGDFPFGQSPEKRPILQKGDNFRIAGSRKPQHYVKQELAIRDYKGSAPPAVVWLPAPGKEPPRAE